LSQPATTSAKHNTKFNMQVLHAQLLESFSRISVIIGVDLLTTNGINGSQ
jgi:hypothetical protein